MTVSQLLSVCLTGHLILCWRLFTPAAGKARFLSSLIIVLGFQLKFEETVESCKALCIVALNFAVVSIFTKHTSKYTSLEFIPAKFSLLWQYMSESTSTFQRSNFLPSFSQIIWRQWRAVASVMAAYGQTQYSPALQPPGPYTPYTHHTQGYSMPSYSESTMPLPQNVPMFFQMSSEQRLEKKTNAANLKKKQ